MIVVMMSMIRIIKSQDVFQKVSSFYVIDSNPKEKCEVVSKEYNVLKFLILGLVGYFQDIPQS